MINLNERLASLQIYAGTAMGPGSSPVRTTPVSSTPTSSSHYAQISPLRGVGVPNSGGIGTPTYFQVGMMRKTQIIPNKIFSSNSSINFQNPSIHKSFHFCMIVFLFRRCCGGTRRAPVPPGARSLRRTFFIRGTPSSNQSRRTTTRSTTTTGRRAASASAAGEWPHESRRARAASTA